MCGPATLFWPPGALCADVGNWHEWRCALLALNNAMSHLGNIANSTDAADDMRREVRRLSEAVNLASRDAERAEGVIA